MKYLYISFITVGLVLLVFAGQQFLRTRNLLSTGIKTNAQVIQMLTNSDSDGNDIYKPVFEFIDQTKTKRTFESSVSSSPPAYEVGELVEVVYDPNDPQDVKVVSFVGLYLLSLVLFFSGGSFFIIGIIAYKAIKKKKGNKTNADFINEYQK